MTALEAFLLAQRTASEDGRCVCLCGEPAMAGSKYHAYDRCRMRAYRHKRDAMAADAGLDLRANLDVIRTQPTSTPRARSGDGQRARPARRKRNPDVRVSYRKALAAVTLAVGDETRAKTILDPCLPPRLKETA